MEFEVNSYAKVLPKGHQPGDNTEANVVLAAAEGVRHVLDKVFGGYDADPGVEKALAIRVTVDGTENLLVYPVSTGDGFVEPRFNIDFNPPLQGDANKELSIKLAAGGAGVAGKVNAVTR